MWIEIFAESNEPFTANSQTQSPFDKKIYFLNFFQPSRLTRSVSEEIHEQLLKELTKQNSSPPKYNERYN